MFVDVDEYASIKLAPLWRMASVRQSNRNAPQPAGTQILKLCILFVCEVPGQKGAIVLILRVNIDVFDFDL